MSNFVPGNYDLRTALIFCYHLKKTVAESHRMSMLLVNHSALSVLKMYENDSMTGLPQKSDSFFGVTSTNCQTGGKNV